VRWTESVLRRQYLLRW